MNSEAVLGLDAGTTTTKAVVVAPDGRILASSKSDPIPTSEPEPGASVQDSESIVAALGQASRRVHAKIGDTVRIDAVAIAAQSGSVAPFDSEGRPMNGFLTWMDARARSVVGSWTEAQRDLIRSVSGWTPATGLGLASISWLRSTRSDLASCPHWASVDDHLLHRLTGVWGTNPSNASGMQLMDVARLEWDNRLCELAGIDRDRLSPIRQTGEIIGDVTEVAAAWTGLGPGTPVVIGGHDQTCTALALGATEPGEMVVSAGTAWVLTAATDRVAVDRLPRALNLSPHVVDDLWTVSQNLGGLGALLDWWRDAAHGPDSDPGVIDEDLAVAASSAGPMFLPALGSDAAVRQGRFDGSRSDHTTADRTRALVEAAAFEVRRALESMSAAGVAPARLVLVGGASRSVSLRHLVADVTGVPVAARPDASWPALGAAALAARALGWPVPDRSADPASVVEPAVTGHDEETRYRTYLRLMEG